jgi:hypothetical protein
MQENTMKNDGGQAFPQHLPNTHGFGMSLRDWFAGQALAGMFNHTGWHLRIDSDDVAVRAYHLADAMLAARNSTPTKGD